MNNLFDTDNYPDSEPKELTIGARWAWTRSDITEAYPTASYTLKYRFIQQDSSRLKVDITAAKTGDAHVVEVSQSVTSKYVPDEYQWQAVVVRDSDSEELVVDRGYIELLPDFEADKESRSWVYRTLQNIRATIEGTASQEQSSYSIAGRSLSRRSLEELTALEREFSQRWQQEKAARDRKQGRKGDQKRIYLKMGA